ncbi:MAG: phosphate ABC transporter, permease protein PstA, partial [Peptococcaceae bacterium]|nr:phosphate ABC transporter, permease protein PstA [Peptococcaceae bacterium]
MVSRIIEKYKKHPFSAILSLITHLGAFISVTVLVFLVAYILIKGVPHITPALFAPKYTSENASLMPALINTILMTLITLLIAAPIGIFSAIYMVEYAKKGSWAVKIIRTTAETLSGLPSIVYGLFG